VRARAFDRDISKPRMHSFFVVFVMCHTMSAAPNALWGGLWQDYTTLFD
jgi:hypothetical protein